MLTHGFILASTHVPWYLNQLLTRIRVIAYAGQPWLPDNYSFLTCYHNERASGCVRQFMYLIAPISRASPYSAPGNSSRRDSYVSIRFDSMKHQKHCRLDFDARCPFSPVFVRSVNTSRFFPSSLMRVPWPDFNWFRTFDDRF